MGLFIDSDSPVDRKLPFCTIYSVYCRSGRNIRWFFSANPLRFNALAQVPSNVTAVLQRRNTILLQQVSNVTSTFTSSKGD